jgi:voltage-gated potassium channel
MSPITRITQTAVTNYHRRSIRRRLRAAVRDTFVLFREFRVILLIFIVTLLISAAAFMLLWNVAHDAPLRYADALYFVTTMLFFEPTLDFPREWYLDLFFFLMPALGVAFFARGIADFAVLLFARGARQEEWEEAVASTFNHHIIVVGLGHLGIRVVRELVLLDEPVVIVELDPVGERAEEIRTYDIPLITGDARSLPILQKAGLERADALIICTNDDLANLQIVSRVREVNPGIRLVMRMFDDQFAASIAEHFDLTAVMSSSGLSAPAFAGAATRTEIVQTFKVDDHVLAMGRVEVEPGSRLDGCHVHDVEQELDVSIVLHQSAGNVDVHPAPGVTLRAGEMIAVVATLPRIKQLANQWNRRESGDGGG